MLPQYLHLTLFMNDGQSVWIQIQKPHGLIQDRRRPDFGDHVFLQV